MPLSAFRLTAAAHRAMIARAEADFPEETCGFVFGTGDALEVVPMENIQNELHASDPERHPRDARTAYEFDPTAMQRVLAEKEAEGVRFAAIYHSHPDHPAYFSETDSAAAAVFGEPNFPGVVHLVYSVEAGRFADVKAFDWSEGEEKFVEIALEVSEE